jgi:AAA15 family ATPase/GTPase
MLLRFGFSNFKSFSEYQEFSLIAADALKDNRSFKLAAGNSGHNVLPCVVFYGANASGKSNTLEAFYFFQRFISASHTSNSRKRGIGRPYFKLSSKFKTEPTTMDADFIINGTHFHYGFSIDNQLVREEWLYQFNYGIKKSRVVLLHRQYDEETSETNFSFSKTLKGKNKSISELTRDNALFLATAAQNNHAQLSEIYAYINNAFNFRFKNENSEYHIAEKIDSDSLHEKIRDIISTFDTGVVEIQTSARIPSKQEEQIFNKLALSLTDENTSLDLREYIKNQKQLDIIHQSSEGERVVFKFSEESLGTQSMFGLMTLVVSTLESGGILFIDEMEMSLHTLVTQEIVSLFNSKESNPLGAQLLFSTHETNLLCCNILRRDQIWFTERRKDNSTELYPLTNFTIRMDSDIESGYLEGRFGAIPFMGDINKALGI